jgi:probable F420-dependent oxidoreductase
MHIGLRLPSNGPNAVAEQIIRIGQLAEKLGFDSLWCNDHIITPANAPTAEHYGRLYEALVTLAALSTVTERVRLGAGVVVLPLREPALAAKQVAAIDAYSNGRMILGVGVGWEPGEYRFLNVDYTKRGRRCDEWIGIIRAVWRGTRITVSTETYDIVDGVSEPRPVQPDGPPILVGGDSAAALRRAAQLGDGWIAGSYVSLDTIADGVKQIRAQAPAGHKGLVYAFRKPTGSFAEMSSVDQMVDELRALQEAGAQGCMLILPEAYTPDLVTEEITLFAENVMPQVR